MKYVLLTIIAFGFLAPQAFGAKANRWCCMVDGKVAKAGKKKMCVKSKKAPTAESKSKMSKKYVSECEKSSGTWEEEVKK